VKMDLVAGAPDIMTYDLDPRDTSAHPGGNAFFTVLADGLGLTYQWQINNGGGFVDISTNATSALYTRTVTAADDQAKFRCVVTGANALTATSREAQFTIDPVVVAFPNPWRADRHAAEQITFQGQ